jgi:hypothetical protein
MRCGWSRAEWLVAISDFVELAIAKVERLGLAAIERASAPAAEDGDLVAGFVHSTIAVNPL